MIINSSCIASKLTPYHSDTQTNIFTNPTKILLQVFTARCLLAISSRDSKFLFVTVQMFSDVNIPFVAAAATHIHCIGLLLQHNTGFYLHHNTPHQPSTL